MLFSGRLVGAAVAASLVLGMLAGPASASVFYMELPAGVACAGFDLGIEGGPAVGGGAYREFTDRDGNLVRAVSAGTGFALTFTNLSTGATVALPSNGAVASTRLGADGTQHVTLLGHNVIILFPSDVPAGPSTTLYVGRVTYTVNQAGLFTLGSSSGTTLDICDAID
jgi:hypothetical protein